MNHNRDGSRQHNIHRGSINYYPNRDNAGHPIPPSQGGYAEYETDQGFTFLDTDLDLGQRPALLA